MPEDAFQNTKNEKKIINKKIILIGLFTGFLSGMFSSGGGLLAVPSFVYFFKLSEKEARAMSIFCVLPMVLTSILFYNGSKFIDWKLGLFCGIGGLIGGIIGTNIMQKINPKYLQLFFIIFLIYSSIILLLKG